MTYEKIVSKENWGVFSSDKSWKGFWKIKLSRNSRFVQKSLAQVLGFIIGLSAGALVFGSRNSPLKKMKWPFSFFFNARYPVIYRLSFF